ncbi:MAG: NADH-quinone oxidoreductase subunit K, partial [Candidatus Cloacimonetes bacterium]|nr:NADH-quinone oxidoreductase subunit K [Candidatus Cloacimonadota bacterium]
GKTAPILDAAVTKAEAVEKVVDPIPSALVLTAIVIGLAVTALMLVYAVQMYKQKKSLNIDDYS